MAFGGMAGPGAKEQRLSAAGDRLEKLVAPTLEDGGSDGERDGVGKGSSSWCETWEMGGLIIRDY